MLTLYYNKSGKSNSLFKIKQRLWSRAKQRIIFEGYNMVLAAGLLIVLALIFGPSLWVKLVMKRHSSEKPEMPGTGGELAKHLIEQFSLKDVKVEVTELGDHYDPIEKRVRLLREHYESKSLTAIAIAAHEVGHAIQDHQGDKRLATRTKMVPIVDKVARWTSKMARA